MEKANIERGVYFISRGRCLLQDKHPCPSVWTFLISIPAFRSLSAITGGLVFLWLHSRPWRLLEIRDKSRLDSLKMPLRGPMHPNLEYLVKVGTLIGESYSILPIGFYLGNGFPTTLVIPRYIVATQGCPLLHHMSPSLYPQFPWQSIIVTLENKW